MSLIKVDWNPEPRQLRAFALLWFPLFAALVGTLLLWRAEQATAAVIVWSLAAPSVLVGLTRPALIRPLYVALLAVSLPIGFVVSYTVLAGVWCLVVTPIGLLLRLRGHDPMTRRLDRSATSYWVTMPPPPPAARYFRQS
ncbi:MAG: SxtJ family membrane protein [Planctomycetota bacterium]